MDLAQKSVAELHQLSHFAAALSEALRDVDDTAELRVELDSVSLTAEQEMSQKTRM